MKRAQGESVDEGKGKKKPEPWEKGYERRVVRTTKPEHKEKGFKWRIKGKKNSAKTMKLYKTKPSFKQFKGELRRIAAFEFG